MKVSRSLVISGILLALLGAGGGAMFYSLKQLEGKEALLNAQSNAGTETARGGELTLTESRDGRPQWSMTMKSVTYADNMNTVNFENATGKVYDPKKSQVLFTFKAPTGQFIRDKEEIHLNSKPMVEYPDSNVQLTAAKMVFSFKTNNIAAVGKVQMKSKDFGTSSARKAVVAMDFSKVAFSGDTVSVIEGKTQ